jgi:hypothetical protein
MTGRSSHDFTSPTPGRSPAQQSLLAVPEGLPPDEASRTHPQDANGRVREPFGRPDPADNPRIVTVMTCSPGNSIRRGSLAHFVSWARFGGKGGAGGIACEAGEDDLIACDSLGSSIHLSSWFAWLLCRPYAMNAGVAGSDCPLRPRSLGVVGVCQSTAVLSSILIL